MSEFAFIATLTLVFVVAALLLVAAAQYSLPVIPFYLIAGVVVGAFIEEAQLLELAQWGIVFLVFAFAVELEPLYDGGLQRDSLIAALVQASLTGGATFGVGLVVGFEPLDAVFFAIASTLGSSLVALSLLERRVRLRSLHERLAEAIHFVEDLLAIAVILLLSAFVYTGGGWAAVGGGLGLFVVALVIRHYLFDRVTVLARGDVEIMMLTGISLLIGFIWLAELAGVSIVVGAFAAGLAVTSEYPHDVETLDAIGYIEDFFAPIFFVTVGALSTVPTVETLAISGILLVAVVIVNPLVTYAVLRWREYDSRTALLAGYSLDQVSEFTLIIAIEAAIAGVLAPALFDAIVLTAIVTMLGSVLTERYAERGYQRLVETGVFERYGTAGRIESRIQADLDGHVVVTGYDREGQQVVAACEEIGHPYLVIESDPTRRETVRDRCANYVFGDAMASATWKLARAESATLIVATVPREAWAKRILDLDIGADTIVRAVDVESGETLLEQGALFVAVPDLLAGEQIVDLVTKLLDGELSVDELHEQGRQRLDRAVEYGPSDVQRIR